MLNCQSNTVNHKPSWSYNQKAPMIISTVKGFVDRNTNLDDALWAVQIITVKLQNSRISQSIRTSSCFDSSLQSDDTIRKATHELNYLDSLWGHYISSKCAYIWISRIMRLKTSASLTARQSLILCCVQGKRQHSWKLLEPANQLYIHHLVCFL